MDKVLINNNSILGNLVKFDIDEEFNGHNLHVINKFISGLLIIMENGVEVIKTNHYIEVMDYLASKSIDLVKTKYEIIKNKIKFTYKNINCEIILQ